MKYDNNNNNNNNDPDNQNKKNFNFEAIYLKNNNQNNSNSKNVKKNFKINKLKKIKSQGKIIKMDNKKITAINQRFQEKDFLYDTSLIYDGRPKIYEKKREKF